MPQSRELTDRYRLEKILRSGREATVLRANDSQSAQAVVVKLITGGDSIGRAEAFAQFARAFAGIRHPNLPRVLDGGLTTDGSSFLVMELLTGIGVDSLVGGTPDRLLPLLAQAAAGLEAMAQRGLIHHNLSTDNLFLASSQSGERIRILGLGRTALGPIPAPDGEAARFRAPELDHAPDQADWHADVYSLAVIACHLLGATIATAEGYEIAVQMPLALSFELANDEALRRVLERCLRADPGQRPGYAEVRAALRLAGGMSEEEAEEPPFTGNDTQPPLASPKRFVPVGAEATPPREEAERAHVIPIAVSPQPEASLAPDAWDVAPPEGHVLKLPDLAAPSGEAEHEPEASTLHLSALSAPDLPNLDPTLFRPATKPATAAPVPDVPRSEPSLLFDPTDSDGIHLGEPDHDEDGPRSPSLAEQVASEPEEEHFLPVGGFLDQEPARAAAATPAIDSAATTKIRRGPPEDEGPMLAAQFLAALDAGNDAKSTPPSRPAPPTRPLTGASSIPPPLRIEPPPLRPPGTFPPKGPASSTWAEAEPRPNTTSSPLSKSSADSVPAGESGLLRPIDENLLRSPAGSPPAEPSGDLLSIDEDLLSAPPPEPTPPPATKGRRGATGARTPPPSPGRTTGTHAVAAKSGGLPTLSKPLLWGGISGLIVILGVAAYFVAARSGETPPPPTPTSATSIPPPPPPPTEVARGKLAAALAFLEDGRDGDGRVRSALDAMTPNEIAALPASDCARIDALRYELALEQRETLPTTLPAAMKSGDLGQIQSLVGIASVNDVPANLRAEFGKAENIASLYRQAETASDAGHPLEALQHFAALQHLERGLRDEHQLQAQAATAIEKEADRLGRDGKYADALSRLEALAAVWPERTGIKELVQSYRQYSADEAKQQRFLASLPTYENRRKPSEALEVFHDLKPTPHLAAQLEEGRKRLEAQLAVLDAQPPQIALRDNLQLQYSRGMTVELSFRVTDDYQVKSVKLNVRPDGSHWQELPLQRDTFSYTIQIPPTVHKNGTIAFYVVATDISGHEGTLGTKDKPLLLTRLGSERLVR
jgi:hypothetical protein